MANKRAMLAIIAIILITNILVLPTDARNGLPEIFTIYEGSLDSQYEDYCNDIALMTDGSVCTAGVRTNGSSPRIILIKWKPNATIEWIQVYNGTNQSVSYSCKILDNHAFTLGTCWSGENDTEALLVKWHMNGTIVNQVIWDDMLAGYDLTISDEGVLHVLGFNFTSDEHGHRIIVAKLDADYNRAWVRIFISYLYGPLPKIAVMSDGSVFAQTADVIHKWSSNGTHLWEISGNFHGMLTGPENHIFVISSNFDPYIHPAHEVDNPQYRLNCWDSNEELVWSTKIPDATIKDYDWTVQIKAIASDSESSVYILVFDSRNDGEKILAKVSSDGIIQWKRKLSNFRTGLPPYSLAISEDDLIYLGTSAIIEEPYPHTSISLQIYSPNATASTFTSITTSTTANTTYPSIPIELLFISSIGSVLLFVLVIWYIKTRRKLKS